MLLSSLLALSTQVRLICEALAAVPAKPLGAVGGGVGFYFTPSIDVLTGPVFFLDRDFYRASYGTDWLWTVQLDVDFDLSGRK